MILCVYLLILSKFILFKYLSIPDIVDHFAFRYGGANWSSHNVIPFKTIGEYLMGADHLNLNIRISNLLGNVIGFIPFGFILPLWSSRFRGLKQTAVATFCLSLVFELLQLVFRFGSFDVDDLILNTLGGMLGCLAVKLVSMMLKPGRERWRHPA